MHSRFEPGTFRSQSKAVLQRYVTIKLFITANESIQVRREKRREKAWERWRRSRAKRDGESVEVHDGTFVGRRHSSMFIK